VPRQRVEAALCILALALVRRVLEPMAADDEQWAPAVRACEAPHRGVAAARVDDVDRRGVLERTESTGDVRGERDPAQPLVTQVQPVEADHLHVVTEAFVLLSQRECDPGRAGGAIEEVMDREHDAQPPVSPDTGHVVAPVTSVTTSRNRVAKRASENRSAWARRRSPSQDSSAMRVTAAAIASGSGAAKRIPVSPSITVSRDPPAARTADGRPNAAASSGVSPKSS